MYTSYYNEYNKMYTSYYNEYNNKEWIDYIINDQISW
jgi:hypothetical protein